MTEAYIFKHRKRARAVNADIVKTAIDLDFYCAVLCMVNLGDGMRPISMGVRGLGTENQHSLRLQVQLKGEHWPGGGVETAQLIHKHSKAHKRTHVPTCSQL